MPDVCCNDGLPRPVNKKRMDSAEPISDVPYARSQWGNQHWKDWRKKLSPADRQAILDWQEQDWMAKANQLLRSGNMDQLTSQQLKTISLLDEAVGRGIIPHDMVVWRGFRGVLPSKLKTGTVFVDNGFAGTSLSYLSGLQFGFGKETSGKVLARIFLPEGSKGSYISRIARSQGKFKEDELLLPRGTKFRVRGFTEDKFGVTINLEVIP